MALEEVGWGVGRETLSVSHQQITSAFNRLRQDENGAPCSKWQGGKDTHRHTLLMDYLCQTLQYNTDGKGWVVGTSL